MKGTLAPGQELLALEEGRAFVDLSGYRKIRIGGGGAIAWLHDLATADVASLEPGRTRRSLLLTPTGRIRADFTVVRRDQDLVLLQPGDQPDPVDGLLVPYVLSSDVSLEDLTAAFALYAVPGRTGELVGLRPLAPSVLGAGVDLFVRTGVEARKVSEALERQGLAAVGLDAVEVWRVRRGSARMGADFEVGSLPAEAGLEWTIDVEKGCFLGQESFARVRNLGHPPTILERIRSGRALSVGEAVTSADLRVGHITSAVPGADGGSVGIARVAWGAAGKPLSLADGAELARVGPAG